MIRMMALFSVCLFTAIPVPTGIAQQSPTTNWKGELDASGQRLRLEIEITRDGVKLTGQIRSIDQNNVTMDLADLELNDDELKFSVPKVGARFSGVISDDGKKAEGTFSQGRGEMRLVLVKAESGQPFSGAALDPLSELGKIVQWYVEKEYLVGGELLVIDKGKVAFHQSFGFSDREDQRPWVNDQLCNIRSMTKPITSAAAQILIDRGLLNLDDPVANYLDSFDNEKSNMITVRQVLTHRSGLPLTNLLKVDQFENLSAQVAAMGKAGPQFEPDSKFWYSDIGTDVVGALVEKVSGELLNEFVQREIFEPLDMSCTLYGIDGSDQRLKQAASLYVKTGSTKWNRFWTPEKPLYPFAWGSQTVYSTTTDYAKFLRMLMDGGRVGDRQVLSNAAVERMLQPVSRMKMLGSDAPYPTGFRDVEAYYGQMMLTHRPIGKQESQPVAIGHSGSDGTNAWAWPQRDLMVLYFTQSRGGTTALKIEKPIDRLLIHPGKKETVPEALQPYVGTFIANYEGFDNEEFTVTARNGKLLLDVPSQMEFELLDPDEDGNWAFAIAPKKIKASFDRNDKDEVTGLRLHKGGKVYEVPRQGTDRAGELAAQKMAAQKTAKEKAAGEKLREAWVGKLDISGMKPVMQFRIVENESGETKAWFDSVTEGQTGFAASWSLEDDQLKFDVAKIKLTFRGTLNEAKDEAAGTWSQGGREFPLTLKKQDKAYSGDK